MAGSGVLVVICAADSVRGESRCSGGKYGCCEYRQLKGEADVESRRQREADQYEVRQGEVQLWTRLSQ